MLMITGGAGLEVLTGRDSGDAGAGRGAGAARGETSGAATAMSLIGRSGAGWSEAAAVEAGADAGGWVNAHAPSAKPANNIRVATNTPALWRRGSNGIKIYRAASMVASRYNDGMDRCGGIIAWSRRKDEG